MSTCRCMRVAEALKLTIAGRDLPRCPDHDPEPPAPGTDLALNDDDGLTAAISAALGVRVNRTPTV